VARANLDRRVTCSTLFWNCLFYYYFYYYYLWLIM